MMAIVRFVRNLVHSFTCQQLLLAQCLAAAIECIAVLSFVMPFQSPPSFGCVCWRVLYRALRKR